MAAVTVDSLLLGEAYDRVYLAKLWGYEGHQAISRGVITPAGQRVIVLFVTRIKQTGYTQYENRFEGDVLLMEGERGDTSTNARLKGAKAVGDRIFLFYRERHHSNFTFYGEASIADVNETPDAIHFTLNTHRSDAIAINALVTEDEAHATASYTPDEEGKKRLSHHVAYERSRRNRAEAIRLHGTACTACGFRFNAFYGAELARDYVEIHHTDSITIGPRTVNPATELVPLCANCHAMVHRVRGSILSIAALRRAIERIRNRPAADKD
jgi:5-methylcytosine-specific restriction enzyme A